MIRRNGFTLIEVLVALFILTGGIMVLATAWSGNFMRIRKSAMLNDAAALLERKMVEIEAKYRGKPIGEIVEEDGGEFEGHPQYSWKMESHDLKLPDLSALIIGTQEADETLISMIKQVTEFLSTAIKEVKVSVLIKRNGKEVEFMAVQYFIDYTKEFAGAAGGTPPPGGEKK